MANQSDIWNPLFDNSPTGIFSSLIAAIGSLTMIIFCGLAYGIIYYDTHINRTTTLLTKFNCTILAAMSFDTATILFDTMRFTTGVPMPPTICRARVFYNKSLRHFIALTIITDTAFHYRFLTFKSNFPIIKDDLVHKIFVRSAVGWILSNVVRRVTTEPRMPMEYYICTGTDPNQMYALCGTKSIADSPPIILYVAFGIITTGLLLLAMLLVLKKWQSTATPLCGNLEAQAGLFIKMLTDEVDNTARAKLVINIGSCLMRILLLITIFLIGQWHNRSQPAFLASSHGFWLVLVQHFVCMPAAFAFGIISRLSRGKELQQYLKRQIGGLRRRQNS